MTRPTVRLLLRILATAGTFLPSRCLATMGGLHIRTRRLVRGIYEVRRWCGLRCHDVHIKFHKDWPDIQKLIGWGGGTGWRYHKPALGTYDKNMDWMRSTNRLDWSRAGFCDLFCCHGDIYHLTPYELDTSYQSSLRSSTDVMWWELNQLMSVRCCYRYLLFTSSRSSVTSQAHF
jgi:hypothetical protein